MFQSKWTAMPFQMSSQSHASSRKFIIIDAVCTNDQVQVCTLEKFVIGLIRLLFTSMFTS